jgi:acetyl-CoA acetyltransferase family protein
VLSDVPITYSDDARRFLTKLSRARSLGERLKLIMGLKAKWFIPKPPALAEPFTGLTMGEHAEIMTVKNNILRERQDAFAYQSHIRAARAQEKGLLKEEVVPVWAGKQKNIFVDKDNMVRSDTTQEALAKLKPVFDRKNGTITAGNASPLTDGASAVLLTAESYAKKNKLPILGYIVDSLSVATDPHDQLLIGPAYAIPRLLAKHNLKRNDIGVYEIHEAFAGQVLSCVDSMASEKFCKEKLNIPTFGEVPLDKLNVEGGAIAIGHPFGATGGRLIGNALRIARRAKSRYAVIGVCAAGGMGVAMLLETNEHAN